MAIGIVSFGGYVPRLRLQRATAEAATSWFNSAVKAHGRGERAMANWDEDAVTMAVEASRDCLTGIDRGGLRGLYLASTTFPFLDRQNAVIVKEALNLDDGLATMDITGSQRAGTSALRAALAAAANGPVLCVASEHPHNRPGSEAELQQGDGAAAFLLGTDGIIAELVGSHSIAVDFIDHYRGAGREFDYTWESRWIREEGYGKLVPQALKAAFATVGFKPADLAHFIMACPFKGLSAQIAKRAGFAETAVRDNLGAVMGEAGSAHPLVMLAQALEVAKPGERIAVIGFGQGVDVLFFQVTEEIEKLGPRGAISGWLKRRAEERNYTKFLWFNKLIDLDRGIRSEAEQQTALTNLYRNRKSILGLVGGRCTKTGTIQFPKTPVSVNQNDWSVGTQEDYPMADLSCRVMSFTADSLAYSPDPPVYFGTVLFDEGGRITADFTDVDQASMEVGVKMRMVFRIKAVDDRRGFTKYFWKAAPAVDVAVTRGAAG